MIICKSDPNYKSSPLKTHSTDRAERRFRHRQLGANGLGELSIFAQEIHVVAPELYQQRWS